MLEYISLYRNPYEKDFNEDIIIGNQDRPIEEFIIASMKEVEAIENITIKDIRKVTAHDEIDLNYHDININYKRKDIDSLEIPQHKHVNIGRYNELIFTIEIETNLETKTIEKRILYPEAVDGFFYNGGKKMKAIWQLVDASTYSQRGKSTLKSRMPIIIYQNKRRPITDINGDTFIVTSYSYAINSKSKKPGATKVKTKFLNPIAIYASKMGLTDTIDFFGCSKLVKIVDDISKIDKDIYYIFPVGDVYIRVDKEIFENYDIVSSVVGMIFNTHSFDFPLTKENMDNTEYWVCRIGTVGSVRNKNLLTFRDKGLNTMYMVERLLDQITISNLRLPDYYKQNIYMVLYWMITEFDNLRLRSNIDMKNKRIRKNEYIVLSSLGKKINENINRIIERRNNSKLANIQSLLEVFNFSSDIIVSGMRSLNDLIKTDDIVNDMDFILNIAFSAKGYQSLAGDGSSKRVPDKYRYVHPSMVGVLDLNTSSNSDVGLSGSFVPSVKLYNGYYFDSENEPCLKRFEFECQLAKEEDIIRGVTLSSFDKFVKYLSERELNEKLTYHKIHIVEREAANAK